MPRYYFHIAYKGTNYRGWQKQRNVSTVQQTIEECLQKTLRKKITCIGCSRTDTGVHAAQYFFHIDVQEPLKKDFQTILNKVLPPDISISGIIEIEGTPHAQFAVTERTYDYFIHTTKDPFLTDTSSYYELKNMDFPKMNNAAQILLKYNDFRAFCKTPDRHDSTICQIKAVNIFKNKNENRIRFQITADRFLKSMIRILVYQLLEVGQGKISCEQFENYLSTNQPPRFLNMAYPQGLFLSKVSYPFLEMPQHTEMFRMIYEDDDGYWQIIKNKSTLSRG